jgi:hypothetical protein
MQNVTKKSYRRGAEDAEVANIGQVSAYSAPLRLPLILNVISANSHLFELGLTQNRPS